MASKTILQEFFDKERREIRLNHWIHLRTAAPETTNRLKLAVSMPLLNHPEQLVGAHTDIETAFASMQKDGCTIKRSKLDICFDGMTVSFFALPPKNQRSIVGTDDAEFKVASAKFDNFALVGEGSGDKRTVDLHFTIYLPGTKRFANYCWDSNHMALYIESEYTQSELEEEDGEDEEEDAGESEGSASGKNGPKELAAEHAKQTAKGAKKKSAKKK